MWNFCRPQVFPPSQKLGDSHWDKDIGIRTCSEISYRLSVKKSRHFQNAGILMFARHVCQFEGVSPLPNDMDNA